MTKKFFNTVQRYIRKVNQYKMSKIDWLIAAFFLVITFVYLTYHLSEEILSGVELAFLYFRFYAEGEYFGFISALLRNLAGNFEGGHMPLFYIFTSPFLAQGLYYPSYMYVSMFFGVLTAPLFYLFSRNLFSRITSILTTLSFVSCFHFFHSIREVDEYSIVPFFFILIMFVFYLYTKSIISKTSAWKHYFLYIVFLLILPMVMILHGYFLSVFAFCMTVLLLILCFYRKRKYLYYEILGIVIICLYPLRLLLIDYTIYIPTGPVFFSHNIFLSEFPKFLSYLYVYDYTSIESPFVVPTAFILGFVIFLLYFIAFIFAFRNIGEIIVRKKGHILKSLLHFFHKHMFLFFSLLIIIVFESFTTTSFRVYTHVFLYPLFIFSIGYTIDYVYRVSSKSFFPISSIFTLFQVLLIVLVLILSVFAMHSNWKHHTFEYHYHYTRLVEGLGKKAEIEDNFLVVLEEDLEMLYAFDHYHGTNHFNNNFANGFNITKIGNGGYFIFDKEHNFADIGQSSRIYLVDSFADGETDVTDFKNHLNESYSLNKSIDLSKYSPVYVYVFNKLTEVRDVE